MKLAQFIQKERDQLLIGWVEAAGPAGAGYARPGPGAVSGDPLPFSLWRACG